MNIRAKSEKGFSLIELLVVVAIIGVLAAVGVVGYQGYIDSTKKSVTDANAKAVHQWLVNTKTVRAAGIDTDPTSCKASGSGALTSSTSAASAVASGGCFYDLAAAGGPFENFKNPYNTSHEGVSAIKAFDHSTAEDDGDSCGDIDSGINNGDIVIAVSGTGGAHLTVYLCAKDGDSDKKLTKRDSVITSF